MADIAFSTLETERLRLRRFRHDDLEDFADYRSDPEIARYQSWDTPFSRAEAEAFLAEMLAGHPDTPGEWYQFALSLREDDRLIGDVALRVDEDDPLEAEIGYTLAASAEGKGYASEGAAAILDYALQTRGKSHVIAWADTRNKRSLALLQRLGFERPDHPPRRSWFKGAWSEETLHRMTAQAWQNLRRAR